MDGYESSLEIVRSPAVVALVTEIATSLGTGLVGSTERKCSGSNDF